jgi:hypothetical protein
MHAPAPGRGAKRGATPKKRRGNIEPLDGPDPFPRTGLTKEYEPFIRGYAGKIFRNWPGSQYEEILNDLVRLSVAAERHHKPEKGKFGTLLFWRFKRITRLLRKSRQQLPGGPSKSTKEDLERERAEAAGEPTQSIAAETGRA